MIGLTTKKVVEFSVMNNTCKNVMWQPKRTKVEQTLTAGKTGAEVQKQWNLPWLLIFQTISKKRVIIFRKS